MTSSGEESPLPRFGLAAGFVGERWVEGQGWDICTVVHRLETPPGDLTVGVIRRNTISTSRDGPRAAISDDVARESVATVLVADLPGIGDDIFDIAAEVAGEADAWMAKEILIDGEVVRGYEREYRGSWVAYYLSRTLIVYVLGPTALRPAVLELETLGATK